MKTCGSIFVLMNGKFVNNCKKFGKHYIKPIVVYGKNR